MIAGGMGDALHGTLLLLVYGLSMTLPFVFAAIFANHFYVGCSEIIIILNMLKNLWV